MQINLKVWRQSNSQSKGKLEEYTVTNAHPNMSFIELLDVLNEQLIKSNQEPIAFDSDCGEGICGSCGMMVNGVAHGEQKQTAVCQLHLRSFHDGDTVTVEPWRAKAFPIVKDLSSRSLGIRPHSNSRRLYLCEYWCCTRCQFLACS